MSDFDREQYEHWFAHACRQAQLLGGITAWAQAPLDTNPALRTTPANALTQIRRLLAQFNAEQTQPEAVTVDDAAA